MKKFSLLCSLLFASSVSAETTGSEEGTKPDTAGVVGTIDIGYKGYKTYDADKDKFNEVAVKGVRSMTYNELDDTYYSLASEGLLAFGFDITDSKMVTVKSAKGTKFADTVASTDSDNFASLVFVENEQDTENAYYIIAAGNKLTWYKGAVGVDGTDVSGIDSKYTAGSTLVGGAALQGAEKYYFVYSSQMGLTADLDATQCPKNKCLRISVNTIEITTDEADASKVTMALTQISQIRYDLDTDDDETMMGLADITLFEDEDATLHAIFVERNDKVYHAALTGDAAKDVSKCDALSHDDCKALEAVKKTEMFTFVSAPTPTPAPTTSGASGRRLLQDPADGTDDTAGTDGAEEGTGTGTGTGSGEEAGTDGTGTQQGETDGTDGTDGTEGTQETETAATPTPTLAHPEGIDDLKFEALSIIYRDNDMTLLDEDNKMSLVAINNNAADTTTQKTHLVFLSWDCSDLGLNLKKVAVEDTTSTAEEEDEDSAAVSSLPFSYITAVAYCCILAVFSKFIM